MQGYFALQQGIAQFWSGEAFYLTVQMGGPWDFYLEKISWAKHKWHRFFIFLFSDYFFLIEKSNDWIILDRILHNGFWENVGMCKHHLKKFLVVSRGHHLRLHYSQPVGATVWQSHVPSPPHFSIRNIGLHLRLWAVKNLLFHCYFKSFE